jgi:hypothetical protein
METRINTEAAEELRAKIRDIQTNPANPRYIGYQRQDPGVDAYIEKLYREVYGSGSIELGDGIVITGSGRAPKAAPAAKSSGETTSNDSHSPYLSSGAGLIGRR